MIFNSFCFCINITIIWIRVRISILIFIDAIIYNLKVNNRENNISFNEKIIFLQEFNLKQTMNNGFGIKMTTNNGSLYNMYVRNGENKIVLKSRHDSYQNGYNY